MLIKGVKYKEKELILSSALIRAKPLTQKESFTGTAPAPFVGRFGYPFVNVGILAPPRHDEDAWLYDAPGHWAKTNTGIREVVDYRTRMVNSRFTSNVKQPDKLVEIAQDVAMASKPVDIDVSLEKKPSLNISTDQWVAPMGPQARLKQLQLATNPHISTKVQKYFDDTDALASEAVTELYKHSVDENALSRMLSVGVFGKKRKLVPTRWSITATDDILANNFLEKVREQEVGDYATYFGSYLGNYYLVLFFPERWSYELFEMYVKPGVLEFSTDYEEFQGRKNYAETCAGGYYTVRMALAEHMMKNKRQNTALVLRFITDEYVLPLGVWVTRSAARKALESKPITFASKELMLTYATHLARKKFGVDIVPILEKSKIMKEKQKTIINFI
ncbi:Uncharacterised protein [uncultured archaeon]|nr:Uncharacterised protein [uncultured archaeon]